ncbi:hypothetical protein SLS58_007482 [Diplodia intermedia]|uniref:Uncharacterized protein n=1 Tax=Diplodia intermedia TaxID=856260 RepID=A0ABR3TK15_9PEZI
MIQTIIKQSREHLQVPPPNRSWHKKPIPKQKKKSGHPLSSDWKPHDFFRSFVRDWDECAYRYAVVTTHKLFLLCLDGKMDPTGRLTTWNGLMLFVAVAHTY